MPKQYRRRHGESQGLKGEPAARPGNEPGYSQHHRPEGKAAQYRPPRQIVFTHKEDDSRSDRQAGDQHNEHPQPQSNEAPSHSGARDGGNAKGGRLGRAAHGAVTRPGREGCLAV